MDAALPEAGWFGSSIVKEIDQNGNIHGDGSGLISLFDGFFFVETPGTWGFTGPGTGASEIEIDEQVVAGRYEADTAAATGNVSIERHCPLRVHL